MPSIERHGSGAPWEPVVGYSRVVRAGPLVEVAGCSAVGPDGELTGIGDTAEQARVAFANVVAALARVGATPADVVRTRMYVTNISKWETIARAHGAVFGEVRPVSSMVEVSALLDPRMLVEVEATAYVL